MRVNAMTDVGRVRSENQDNYRVGVLPHGAAWGVVCDGMGGGYDGSLASTLAVDAIGQLLMEKLQDDSTADEIRDWLSEGIQKANKEIFEHSGSGKRVMGTTVVCAVMQNGYIHLAHVGDSRAYLFQNGLLSQLTHDHSVVQELIDQGQITEQEAISHPEKNVITRALGVDELVEIEYKEYPQGDDITILLCTDGLTNMVQGDRITEILNEAEFYSLAKELVGEALLCGGADNITVVLMEHKEVDDNAG